jgi:hypothetical protein
MSLRQLRRIRWAVRGVLTLGVAASVTANVLHANPNPVSQAIAAWPPLALLLTIELISRVPVHRRSLATARMFATVAIAGIAAWVSYWHMASVVSRYGETGAAPYLMPVSVDGLVIVASVCLVELAGRIRAVTESARPAVEPVPVAAPVVEADGIVPALPAGTGAPRATRTGTPRKGRTGTRTAKGSGTRTDADLIAALADVPRDADGSVPVRRAAAALGCGVDRARRLLAAQGLLRTDPQRSAAPVALRPVPA